MNKTSFFNSLFKDFQQTALLWKKDDVLQLKQFCINNIDSEFQVNNPHKKLRLGKWVEQFVSFQLKQISSIKILSENLQIQDDKQTIGELDLLFEEEKQPIHLEIIYKFYLYDNSKIYNNLLEYWIGPNRNDTLIYKLKKLKERQLPLLYHNKTKKALENLNLRAEDFKQYVNFKAQLFLPYNNQNVDIDPLNTDCIQGWYLNFEKISMLKNYLFYIPEKLEWINSPHNAVDWLAFENFIIEIEKSIAQKRSPLCWIKDNTNGFQKCFITWW